MKYMIKQVFLVWCCVIISGCGRWIDWGKASFYQGEQVPLALDKVEKNIRSIAIYDQFTTRARFDALLLTDEVRACYVDVFTRKQGKTSDQYNSLLRRQWEENKHYVTFYVLSIYEKPLGEKDSEWNLFLRIGSTEIVPIEVKSIDLPIEYQLFFGPRFNRFKIAYGVKFNIAEFEDNELSTSNLKKIGLIFRAHDKEAMLEWGDDYSITIEGEKKG